MAKRIEDMKTGELEQEIWWEKRAKKILLICSGVCCGIGLIIGVVTGLQSYGGLGVFANVFSHVFLGIWFGTGIGGAIGYISVIPRVFKETMEEEGFKSALVSTLLGLLFWLIIFGLLGPVSLLIRILRMNFRIRRFEKRLRGEY